MTSRGHHVPLLVAGGMALALAGSASAEASERAGAPVEQSEVQIQGVDDFDWKPYAKVMRARVTAQWWIPEAAVQGAKGIATVHFFITPEGHVRELDLVAQRGSDELAHAALLAVRKATPLPPLPPGIEERVGVTWTFTYNVTKRAQRRWIKQREAAPSVEEPVAARSSDPTRD